MTITVTLTASEMLQAAIVGCSRRITSVYRGRDDKSNGNIGRENNWTTDIYGAAGEMAFAKAIGFYFSASVNTFKEPDVGTWQVRTTHYKGGHLLVRHDDEPAARYVLVIADPPQFHVVGYMVGGDAKVPKYAHSDERGPDCFKVPQEVLQQIELPGMAA